MSESEKQKKIVEFYKDWTVYWDNVRGDVPKPAASSNTDHRASNTNPRSPYVRLVEESLRFAGVSVEDPEKWPKKVLDVGCGVGGATRYFAAKFGAECIGINISAYQVERANAVTSEEGLADKASFVVADAMDQPFPDGQFDLVWCMDTAEYMSDRKKFVSELARVTAPEGTIIIILTCQRNLRPEERSIGLWERTLIRWVCDAGYFCPLCSSSQYVNLMKSFSLEDVKETNITDLHAPLWSCSMNSILSWKGFTSMFTSGLKALRGVFSVPLLVTGYKTGVLNVTLITCRKTPPMKS